MPALSAPTGGGAIRGIGEKFTVNTATGTAGLTIPLPASPGRNGAGPEVSLSYSSGGGNGPFGLGFDLSVPSITRKTDKGLPRYLDAPSHETDTFVLSGAEDLVPTLGEDGQHVRADRGAHWGYRYRPRTEGLFARVERWVHKTSGDVHWQVTTKDNVTHVYGPSAASRIFDPAFAGAGAEARVFTWLLAETRDDKGNVTKYEYKAEDGAGVDPTRLSERSRFDYSGESPALTATAQKYLKRVLYGNRVSFVGNAAADFLFELVFDYGEHAEATSSTVPTPGAAGDWLVRQDAFSSYRSGFEVRTYRLCRRVLMFHRIDTVEPLLVRATEFDYEPHASFTYLVGVTQAGFVYDEHESVWVRQAMPKLALDYQRPEIHDELQHLPEESLEGLTGGTDGARKQWVDLDGEGIAGVLIDQGGSWFYKENRGGGELLPPRQLRTQPSPGSLAGGQQKLEDIDGDGRLELVSYEARFSGYFERTESGGFEPLRSFEALPRIDWNDPNLRVVDLDGDGHADLLLTEDQAFVWYKSRAKQGFEESKRVAIPFDENQGPRVVFANSEQQIQLADMSGDGLVDIVRVRNGEVSYWPNLGYGRFGKKVTLENSPTFDTPDHFHASRVRFGDADGSGTSDLFYARRDGVVYYENESGNRLAAGVRLRALPPVDSVTQLSVTDLLGTGTSCLVWSSPLGLPRQTVLYVDLLGSKKPHLLTRVDNHLGATTSITYASSTKFYLEDKRARIDWLTRLPFPVQVVERMERFDAISGGKLVSRYRYRHGFFDGFEREFRGFARVEQWDAEEFPEEGQDPLLYQPPAHTISWFHTGAWLEKERLELALQREYFQEGPPGLLVPDTILPPGLSIQDAREAARALRGSLLRTEVYADDGTEKAELPYVITEQNQEVRLLQPSRGENRYGVVFAFARETVTVSTERNLTDPRVAHELTLDVDAFGNVTRNVSLVYARAGSGHQPEQTQAYATLTETSFINRPGPEDLEEPDQEEHWYRLGVEVEQKVFEVTGLAAGLDLPAAGNGLVDIEALRAALDELDPGEDLPFEANPSTGVERRLLDHKQQVFYADDLSGSLALGELESLALPYETYQLALTTGQVGALVTESGGLGGVPLNPTLLTSEGGYVTRTGGYWAPSGRVVFDEEHFYLPVEAIDPFGNHAYVEWDDFSLLVEKTEDALESAIVAVNDYRVLAPRLLTDPNLNQVEVAYDALGLVVKTAVMGKEGEGKGDTLEHPTTELTYDVLAFEERGEPAYVHTKAREEHFRDNPSSRIQESYTYSDGFGRVVMTKVQAEPGPVPGVGGTVDPRWVGTGRTVFNNKGNPVKQYEPYFSATSDFEDEEEIVETGVTPILRYDSLDRLIQTDLPDGTLTRVVFDSWRQEEWDPNDTVLESEWYVRREEPDPLDPEPSVPSERAAWLSAQHAETPTVTHLDTLGRPFLSVAHNKTGTRSARVEAFYRTRTRLDIDGNTRALFDAKQHATTVSPDSLNLSGVYATIEQRFDVLGRRLRVDSPDAGARLTVADAAGKPLRSWDSKGQTHWSEYDALQRPTHQWVHDGTHELLVQRLVYGEALDPSGPSDNPASPSPAQALNLLGQAHLVYDSAGVLKSEEHDFKGNLLEASRSLTLEYTETPDWGALAALTAPSAIESAAASALSAETFTTETEYDALNRVVLSTSPTTSTAPAPSVTRPVYNEANLLEELRVAVRGGSEASVITNLDYNARGQRTVCACENGVTTNYTYDAETFRLVEIVSTRTSPATTLQHLTYFYDAVGNIVEVQDTSSWDPDLSGALGGGSSKYRYDALYRLTEATGREHEGQQPTDPPTDQDPPLGSIPHGNDLTALRTYVERIEYDEVGNITEMRHLTGPSQSQTWTRLYAYVPGSNRLDKTYRPSDTPSLIPALTYDAHGSMTTMSHLSALDWDYADRLQHVDKGGGGEVYFTYDASGQRVRKVWEHASIIEERIYLGGYEIYRKWDGPIGDLGTTLELERETLHLMDDQRRVAMVETKTEDPGNIDSAPLLTPRRRYQLTNHLDSAVMEVDASAGIISYEECHPYGSTALHLGDSNAEVSAKRYRYTGKERDEETGLYYHEARYYAPWLGRWTAADPAGLVDGLNLYRYSRDNPINFSDPGGTQATAREEELGMSLPEEHIPLAQESDAVGATVDQSGYPVLISASGSIVPRSPSVEELGALPQEENEAKDTYVNVSMLYGLAPSQYFVEQRLVQQFAQTATPGAAASRVGFGLIGLGLLATSDTPISEEINVHTNEGEPERTPLYIFRGMREFEGMPEVGPGARTLGVRADFDIPVSPQGVVSPGTGGMSVAPLSPYNLPEHRRPPGFGGTGKDPVWAFRVEGLGPSLQLEIDSPTHGTVQPSMSMDMVEFESALGATAPLWKGPIWSPVDVSW